MRFQYLYLKSVETKWILITVKMVCLPVKMSSYELGGRGVLAKDFAGKNENSFYEALEEKWRKNSRDKTNHAWNTKLGGILDSLVTYLIWARHIIAISIFTWQRIYSEEANETSLGLERILNFVILISWGSWWTFTELN